jgi:hypothetical protein
METGNIEEAERELKAHHVVDEGQALQHKYVSHSLIMTRKSEAKWINKALKVGVVAGLQDTSWQHPEADGRGQGLGGPLGLLQTEGLRVRC